MNIGVISDTHGLLRPEALHALENSDLILHAGDVGSQEILDALSKLAPVIAVRGNCDHGAWAEKLAAVETVAVGDLSIFMIHNLQDLTPTSIAGCRVVISGHTHKPRTEMVGDIFYLNPGSAGRRRFKLPTTIARLTVDGVRASAEIVLLLRTGG